uniref:Uncharacterized protein n=1 Tax=Cajanus cajan TaxID=3821 RepID=A0A151QQ31_CAJCA|nr:hypothetical protein KK1_046925 [Cajanus cajan]
MVINWKWRKNNLRSLNIKRAWVDDPRQVKKEVVQGLLSDAKVVTTFIYNHTWIVNLMKKYARGREIFRLAVLYVLLLFELLLSIVIHVFLALCWVFTLAASPVTDKNGLTFETRQIIIGSDFWSKANDILKVFEPLVKVFRLVDGDEKPTMGFIYEAIDRAKSNQKNSRYYSQYQEIIDKH